MITPSCGDAAHECAADLFCRRLQIVDAAREQAQSRAVARKAHQVFGDASAATADVALDARTFCVR